MSLGILFAVFLLSTILILYSSYNLSVTSSYIKQNGDWHLYTSNVDIYNEINEEEIESVTAFNKLGYSRIKNEKNKDKPYIYIGNLLQYGPQNKPIDVLRGELPSKENEIIISNQYANDYDVNIGDTITLDIGKRMNAKSNSVIWQNSSFTKVEDEIITYEQTRSYNVVGVFKPFQEIEYGFSPGYACLAYESDLSNDSQIYVKFYKSSNTFKYVNGIDAHASDYIKSEIVNIFQESERSIMLIIVISLCTIILIVCCIFILNNYAINEEERIKYFGTLSSIGTTKNQLFAIAMFENLFLSIIVVPFAVLSSYTVLSISFQGLSNLINNMTFKSIDFMLNYKFTLIITLLLVGIILSLVSSAIAFFISYKKGYLSSIKQNNTIKNKHKTSKKSLANVRNELVFLNFARRKMQNSAALVSVILSLSLLLSSSIFFDGAIRQIKSENSFYYQVQANCADEDALKVFEDLCNTKGVKKGFWRNFGTLGYSKIDYSLLTEQAKLLYDKFGQQSVSYNFIDNELYNLLLNTSGIELKENQYIAYAKAIDYDSNKEYQIFKNEEVDIEFNSTDENVIINDINVKIFNGILPIQFKQFGINEFCVFVNADNYHKIFRENPIDYNFYFECNDYITAYESMVAKTENAGWETSINNNLQYADFMVSGYLVIEAFFNIFMGIILVISIINLTSSIAANIKKRKKDLAILSSIGMLDNDIKKMLFLEVQLIYIIAVSLSFIIIGVLAVIMKFAFGFAEIVFPFLQSLIICITYEIIILITTALSLRAVLKGTIINSIRNDIN